MKLSYGTLYYYALPAFSLAMLGLPLYIYLPTYYIQDIGISATQVGLVLFLSRLLDLILDPWIGTLSDRFKQKKKIMLLGVLMLLLGFFALSYPQSDAPLWLLFFSFLAYTGWSLITVPYLALSADIPQHTHDNTRLASAREVFTLLGLITALLIPYLLNIAEDAEQSVQTMFTLVLISLPVLFVLFYTHIKEPNIIHKGFSFFKGLWYLHTNVSHARALFMAFFTNSLANALPATLFLFYVEHLLQAPEQTGLFLIIYFSCGIVALPLWLRVAKYYGKKRTWIIAIVLSSTAFAYVPFLQAHDTTIFTIITVLSGLCLGADLALPASIQADIAQEVEEHSYAFSGVLFGLWSMLTKLSLAFAVGIAFFLLGLYGFNPHNPNPQSLSLLSYLYGLAPVIFKAIALFYIVQYRAPSVIK